MRFKHSNGERLWTISCSLATRSVASRRSCAFLGVVFFLGKAANPTPVLRVPPCPCLGPTPPPNAPKNQDIQMRHVSCTGNDEGLLTLKQTLGDPNISNLGGPAPKKMRPNCSKNGPCFECPDVSAHHPSWRRPLDFGPAHFSEPIRASIPTSGGG